MLTEAAEAPTSIVHEICIAERAQVDIIFLHGLTGDPLATWTSGATKKLWPTWLCEKFPTANVYSLRYPASIFEQWAKKEMDLHERAANILEMLASRGFGVRPIIFVTHSLGGLLAKEMLRIARESSDPQWLAVFTQTRLTVFLATPHHGAALAAVFTTFFSKMSPHVKWLSNDSGYLPALNQAYRELAVGNITTVAYYEKYKTKNVSVVVPRESADPGIGGTHPIPVDADHEGICKPLTKDDLVFVSICRHIQNVISSCPTVEITDIADAENYAEKAETDRRDLLQKLIDAGREHEYPKANDLQSKFARRYYRLGLYTDARNQSDRLLSQVEQRFTTHVYHNRICKDAGDDEIAESLQKHVIDPVSQEACGGNPSSVLQALYFLTEQCHIRWDKP